MLMWLWKAFVEGWNAPDLEDELTWAWLYNDGMKPTRRQRQQAENAREMARVYLKGE